MISEVASSPKCCESMSQTQVTILPPNQPPHRFPAPSMAPLFSSDPGVKLQSHFRLIRPFIPLQLIISHDSFAFKTLLTSVVPPW